MGRADVVVVQMRVKLLSVLRIIDLHLWTHCTVVMMLEGLHPGGLTTVLTHSGRLKMLHCLPSVMNLLSHWGDLSKGSKIWPR